jgi:hypothetical protein
VIIVLVVMMPERRDGLAAQRCSLRRRREDEAPRLSGEVPALTSFRLEVEERAGAAKYIRRFVINRASALFVVPCGDPRCAGEHDLTATVMRALRAWRKLRPRSRRVHVFRRIERLSPRDHFLGTAEYRNAIRP